MYESLINKLNKSLQNKTPTFSGQKLQGRTKFQGMDISIENKKGSIRKWENDKGEKGQTKMKFDYGYIRNTLGNDKDHIDVYLGNNPKSTKVFVIHQQRPDTKKHDEDKVMLGFNSESEAKKAYLQHIPKEWFGSINKFDIDKFKEKTIGKKVTMIKSLINKLETAESSNYKSLIDKLIKGGEGSGKKGHSTVKPGMTEHLTTSGKKIPEKFTSEMQTQGWTADDHKEAMNFHYEVAKRLRERIVEHKASNPKHKHSETANKFINDRFSEAKVHQKHMSRLMSRSDEVDKKQIKKSEMEVDKQGTTIETSDYAKELDSALGSMYLKIIEKVMQDYNYGDEPRIVQLDNGILYISKVDDGIYSGYVRRNSDVLSETICRIEKMTIPTMIQYLKAKEVIDLIEKPSILTSEAAENLVGKLEPHVEDIPVIAPSTDKIRVLELIKDILNG